MPEIGPRLDAIGIHLDEPSVQPFGFLGVPCRFGDETEIEEGWTEVRRHFENLFKTGGRRIKFAIVQREHPEIEQVLRALWINVAGLFQRLPGPVGVASALAKI